MPTTTQSVTGVRYLWADNRIVDILRLDYNPNQPRDNRGRFASGGGGGGGSSGGGKKGGGGGGLTSMKASDLQILAEAHGIDINTLSHKRRKSVLAAAIEAKKQGKDLREEGLLKPTKVRSSLAEKRSKVKTKTPKLQKPTGTHSDFAGRNKVGKLAEKLGIPKEKAQEISKSLKDWSVTGYISAIDYQRNTPGMTPGRKAKGKKITEDLNEFLYNPNTPRFKGEISRGIKFRSQDDKDKFFASLEKDGVQLKNHSSFSSDRNISSSFAGDTDPDKPTGAVLVVKSNKSGASIRPFSNLSKEDEVLVPIGAKYKMTKTSKKGNLDVIELEEVI